MIKKVLVFLIVLITIFYTENSYLLKNQAILTKKISENKNQLIFEGKQKDINLKLIFFKNEKQNFYPEINDKVIFEKLNNQYVITDFYRIKGVFYILILFLLISFFVIKKQFITTFLGLFLSFFIIFSSIIPNILSGYNPVISVILAAIFVIPINYYLTHGFNNKSHSAILGSIIGLVISLILGYIFTKITYITGTSSEESNFILALTEKNYDFRGIFIASIIIGVLGSIDDVTINQASVVEKIVESNKSLKIKEIYKKAIDIGKDHINSIINTLILVYTSASLPLLLLFQISKKDFLEVLNYEIIASEIIRTLVATISTIIVIPLTTYFAIRLYKKN